MLKKQIKAMQKGRRKRDREFKAKKQKGERSTILYIEFMRDRVLAEHGMIFIKTPIPRAKILEDNEIRRSYPDHYDSLLDPNTQYFEINDMMGGGDGMPILRNKAGRPFTDEEANNFILKHEPVLKRLHWKRLLNYCQKYSSEDYPEPIRPKIKSGETYAINAFSFFLYEAEKAGFKIEKYVKKIKSWYKNFEYKRCPVCGDIGEEYKGKLFTPCSHQEI